MNPDGLSPNPSDPVRFHGGETDVLLRHGGAELAGTDLRSVIVEHEAGRVPYAVLLFNPGTIDRRNSGVQGDPEAVVGRFRPGDAIELEAMLRGKGRKVRLFVGEVTKVKLQATGTGMSLRVEARARCHRMTMRRRTAAYADQTETDVMAELMHSHDVNGTVEAHLAWRTTTVQHNATDWDFMLARAEANGLVIYPKLDRLTVANLMEPTQADARLLLGENILEFESELDATTQYDAVEAWGWNDQSRAFEEVELDTQSRTALPEAGNKELNHGGGRPYDELMGWSQGEVRRMQLAETRSLVRVGGSEFWPGMGIELAGLGDQFDGVKLLSGVRHELNSSGWTTQLQLGVAPGAFLERHPEAAAAGAGNLLPAVQGLQIGIVRGLSGDPDGANRIEVSLVAAGDNAGRIWARWASPQAGNGSGAFFLPDIDDEVVVGFLHGDPRDAVVLGALYSRAYSPAFEMTDQNPERGIQSPQKSRIVIDDQLQSVEISTADGSNYLLVQAGDSPGIDITDQFHNSITLSDQGIQLRSQLNISVSTTADLELKGTNVTVEATMKAKVVGNAGAELTSPAITTVKGSLVQIN